MVVEFFDSKDVMKDYAVDRHCGELKQLAAWSTAHQKSFFYKTFLFVCFKRSVEGYVGAGLQGRKSLASVIHNSGQRRGDSGPTSGTLHCIIIWNPVQ